MKGSNYIICHAPRYDGGKWVIATYWSHVNGTYGREIDGRFVIVERSEVPSEREMLAAWREYERHFPASLTSDY